MASILGQNYPSNILGAQGPQMGILGGLGNLARGLFNPAGFGMAMAPTAQAAAQGMVQPLMQANQAMPWGGNDPSAIGIDTQAGTIDPSVMVPFATNVAGMATTGSMAGPAVPGAAGMGIRAYHGSPHDFDRFSMEKIGTGEGAQAYGHGLYFAENPAVAGDYRNKLSDWKPASVSPDSLGTPGAQHLAKMIDDVIAEFPSASPTGIADVVRDRYTGVTPPRGVLRQLIEDAKAASKPTGRMYEVDIDASPDEFLDWDKPLSEQPAYQKILDYAKEAEELGLGDVYKDFIDASKMRGMTGGDFLTVATNAQNKNRAAISGDLRAAGIKGIRYKDAGSRTAEGGTHNYVVFDDATINILKKYGLAGLTGGGAAAMALGGSSQDASAAQPTYRTGGGF